MFVLLLKYHALQLFVDLLSNHQLTKLNILAEFCCSLCAFPVPLAQPLLLFHYPSHGHIRARAKQRHWLEGQKVLTADLSFWWFGSCTFLDMPQKYLIPQTITCYLNVQWGFERCMGFIHQLIAFPGAMVWCLVELQLDPVNFLISSEFLIFVHFFHV